MSRINNIKKASWVGFYGNSFLAVLKLTVGFMANSLALLGDGIDSATDILTSLLTLWVAKIIDKPPDVNHPYGHGRAETIATRILSFIIFYAGIQLIMTSIQELFSRSWDEIPGVVAIYVTLISIVIKSFLSYYKYKIARKEKSSMLMADAKNMRNDIVLSVGVLFGLLLTSVFQYPLFDKLIALLIGMWIIKVAIHIFLEENNELMEGVSDTGIYAQLFKAVASVDKASNPHRARIRKIGSYLIVDLDIEVSGEMSVYEGHEVAKEVEKTIRNQIDNVYDVLIHIEPKGNVEEEKYGVSSKTQKEGVDVNNESD
ncbi:MAG TPA: cation diffusion facilitator family transporter [Bacteroidales bacterium]|nr:cation diffusion facilitator family transporter [Bacteroidales bacterium]HRW33605.1 cation diffusion facilitator family transporter [Thermotogota bacterium]